MKFNLPIWVKAVVLNLLGGVTILLGATPSDELLDRLKPEGFVNDFAGVLTPSQREALEKRVRATQEKNGAEIAVVTVQSMEGGQVDDFTHKLFQKWGVGQKGRNNGVMLLVAIQDRKARIEVGYGLEPALPDALAGRILNEELFPAFKQQAYADGLTRSVERVAEIIEGGKVDSKSAQRKPLSPEGYLILGVALLGFAAGGLMQGCSLGNGEFPGCSSLGLLAFAGVMLSLVWQGSPACAVACVLAALVMAGLGFYLVRYKNWQFDVSSDGSSDGGGWSGGGGFSDGGGGGFGGGSSGGGGASGGW